MKIAVYLADQNPHRDRTLGITNYTKCLLSGLSMCSDIHLTTIVSKSSYVFHSDRANEFRLPWRTDNALARIFTDNFGPALTTSIRPDVFYYPKGYVSFFLRPSCPVIGTIHDTILQFYADHYPCYRSRLDFTYWIGLMKASLEKFDLVLADSQTTERHILEFCNRYRLRTPLIKVSYAASDYEDAEVRPELKRDYIVHFASEAPHKRTRRLLELWKEYQRHKNQGVELKLIGRKTPLVDEFLRCQNVSHVSCSSDSELALALQGARALVLPSEIEGFGLPALEAYYHGTPVCFVRGTSVEEILLPFTPKGGFSLDDGDSFDQALQEVLNMSFDEILKVRDGLRKKFSKKNLIGSVAEAFRHISGH